MRVAAPAILLFLSLFGCGGPSAMVSGTITCQGKPVPGSVLISPKGEDAANSGAAVSAPVKDDGSFEIKLATIGKHTIVVSPRERKYPVKAGEAEFPCDLSPLERDINAGPNILKLELTEAK